MGARRPALDGIRAIAVLAVMAHHFAPTAVGGSLGVDVFFVLSGYLITSLLIAERRSTGTISLSRFYIARAFRLLPALLVLFLVVDLLWQMRPHTSALGPIGTELAVLVDVANWVSAVTPTGLGYLVHMWSLALEEQFYLLWPLLLLSVVRRTGNAPRASHLLALSVLVVVLRAAAWIAVGVDGVLYLTPTRADGLLVGVALALALEAGPLGAWHIARSPRVGLPAAAVLLVLLAINVGPSPLYLVSITLAVAATAALVAHVELNGAGITARLLSVRPLPAIGRISYSLYLYHFPIALFLYDPTDHSVSSFALKLVLSFACAIASYRLIEAPALRLRRRLAHRAEAPTPAPQLG
jgi:peptidoglycan/LPS O-acetylase OafA/YrhL